jgi:hypothetical protein
MNTSRHAADTVFLTTPATPALARAPRMTALACALLSTVAVVASIGALAEHRSDAALLAQHAVQPVQKAQQPGAEAARV